MNNKKINIFLPIETINRELEFKIVLAYLLGNKDVNVYIGQHDFLMKILPKFNGGLYIGKNLFTRRSDVENGKKHDQLKKHNFDIIYLHEEGAVFAGDEENWKRSLERQYSFKYFDNNDLICVWGEFQKSFDKSRRDEDIPINVTGHPRFDLYKKKWSFLHEAEVTSYIECYGNFILINGNYGMANHGLGIEHVFSDSGNYEVKNIPKRLDRVGFFAHSGKQLLSMLNLTHQLAVKFPDTNFIYRPHPSENHNYYKTIFKGIKNIKVRYEGSVSAWIMGAKAIIHDGCTTALEATFAGKPVINFKEGEETKHDIWLPNQMGVKAKTIDEVVGIMKNLNLHNGYNLGNEAEKVKSLMYNFEGDSFEKFTGIIKKKIKEKKENELFKNPSDVQFYKAYKLVKAKERLYSLNLNNRQKIKYHKTKFLGFDKSFIEAKIILLNENLEKNLTLKFHNSYLFELKS